MPLAVRSRAYDSLSSGVNPNETVLTAQAVATRGLRRLFSVSVPGDARGAEAQPLVLPSLKLADGQVRDLHITATMANQVAATDLQDGSLLWATTVGRPILGSQQIDAHEINDHWGILSTPVIHPDHPLMYACAWVSADGSVAAGHHHLVEVNLRSGRVTRRIDLEGAVYDPGGGLPVQRFASAARKQRASLKIHPAGAQGTVIIPFGSIYESAGSNRGWVLAVDIAQWRITAAWCTAVRGSGGGIWMAGAGVSIDDDGSIYLMTGNGDFDAKTEWGECVIKLRYTPPLSAAPAVLGRLTVADWWSPFLDDLRGPKGALDDDDARAIEEPETATNMRKYALAGAVSAAALAGDVPLSPGAARDIDLGSGAPAIVGDYIYAAGKDGVAYVLNKHSMGKTQPDDLRSAAGVRRNYAKAVQILWFTFYPGATIRPDPDNIADLNYNFGGLTHHQHGSPLVWKDAPNGPRIFCWGENENLRAWQAASDGKLSFIASGEEIASANARKPPGGMPGGFMCLTYDQNRAGTAVLWAGIPYGDANREVTKGRLLAYDATQFRHGPNGAVIPKIWDSQVYNHDIDFVKFTPPTVANGRLLVPNYSNGIITHAYGLA